MSDRDAGELRAVRLDKWLWAARFFKTRSLAADAIDGGKVDVNDERGKRARLVRLGDRVCVRKPPFAHEVEVRDLSERRGSGQVAATLYDESPASRQARETLALQLKAMGPPMFRDKGRPGKKDRRDIDRIRGREE